MTAWPVLHLAALTAGFMCSAIAAAQQPSPGSSPSKNAKPEGQENRPRSTSDADAAIVYRNPRFGFSYRVPYGWVERTKQFEGEGTDRQEAEVLLAVFERPPEVTGDSVNSAVVIAREKAATYPGLKSAADYLGMLTELTLSKGFTAVESPYEYQIGGRALARADFSKQLGMLAMRQSSLVMLAKGSLLSFTFIGGSEREVEQLMEGLSFTPAAAPNPRP